MPCQAGSWIGGVTRDWEQLSMYEREREITAGQVPLLGARVEDTSTRCKGISLVCLSVTKSQEKTRSGTCGRDQPYYTGTWLPGQGAHCLFVGCQGIRKI